jgi:hypothetical protein
MEHSGRVVGFRIYRRKSLGKGLWAGVSKSGVSFGRRGRRLSGSVGRRRGPGGSVRIMKGISYLFGGKRR